MKKLILALMIGVIAPLGYAQNDNPAKGEKHHYKKEHKSPEEHAKFKADKMKEKLDLTDKQRDQVYEIFLEENKKREEAKKEYKEKTKEEREAFRKKMKTQREDSKTRMKEVLTEEQLKKMEEMKAERKKKRTEKRKEHRDK